MARGGYRPGGGRPRLTESEKAERAEARKLARKIADKAASVKKKGRAEPATKAKVGYSPAGKKAAGAPAGWPFGTEQTVVPESSPAPQDAGPDPETELLIPGAEPLEFLQSVINETRLKLATRIRAAEVAIGYKHAKPAPMGKKEGQIQEAKKRSRFAPSAPPKLAAIGGKKV